MDEQNPSKQATADSRTSVVEGRGFSGAHRKMAPAKVPAWKPEDEEKESVFARYRVAMVVGAVLLAGAAFAFFHKPGGKTEAPRKAPEQIVMVKPLPPPPKPPPPPPPKTEPPKDQKTTEKAPDAKPMEKPAPPKPAEKPPEGLGTNIKGSGPGVAGLGSSGNGMLGGTGTGSGNGGDARRWYAGQVQKKIADALRANPKSRKADIRNLKFTAAVDGAGRITSITLVNSTGDAALDAAIRNEILPGLQLAEPPPGGKPMKVTMLLSARRPN